MNSKVRWGLGIVAVVTVLLVVIVVSLLAGPVTSNLAYAETLPGAAPAQAATPTIPTISNHDQHHDATAAATMTPTVVTGVTTSTMPSASGMMNSNGTVTGTMPSGMMSGDMLAMMQGMHDQMAQMMNMMDIMMGSMMSSSGVITGTMYSRMMPGTMSGDMAIMMQNMRSMMGQMTGMMSDARMMDEGALSGRLSSALAGIKPLTVTQVQLAVSDYLAGLGNSDLVVTRVLVFDNHAYARVAEKSTGIGAFEVLVDPVTKAVYPEPGANVLWNLKYGRTSGVILGMMGNTSNRVVVGSLPVSATDAPNVAQRYLDTYLPGAKAAGTAIPFYGYYSVEILRDGKFVGILSVNGYSRQVILHSWHGNVIESADVK